MTGAPVDRTRGLRPRHAPQDYLQRMSGPVVGIEILITRLPGKRKLSQNRSARDRMGVVQGLPREASPAARELADLMG